MKVYHGLRTSTGCEVIIEYGNEGSYSQRILDINPSLKLRNHSPTGFEWGYGGSGPAQLALALLYDVTKDRRESLEWYQRFKVDKIMHLPHECWKMTSQEIIDWLQNAQVKELMS